MADDFETLDESMLTLFAGGAMSIEAPPQNQTTGPEVALDLEDTIQMLESHAGSNHEVLEWRRQLGAIWIEGAAGTHPGVRPNNEDAFLVWPDANLLVVADGMGGRLAGEVASGLAIEHIRDELMSRGAALDTTAAATYLEAALRAADAAIEQRAQDSSQLHGMGTTAVAAWLVDGHCVASHAGDSRLYRLRDGELKQMTNDHNIVAELVRRGVLTPERAAKDPRRNQVLSSLGNDQCQLETVTFQLLPGDRVLICTDGLSDLVSDAVIEAYLSADSPPRLAVDRLISAALSRGGHDNITIVVVQTA